MRIALREETSERAVNDVREGHADIAIFSGATNSQDLETFAYHQDHLVVVMPKDHPLETKKTINFSQILAY